MLKEFDDLPWHEAKLLSIQVGARDANQQATVCLKVAFDQRYGVPTKQIAFLRCTYIVLKCDLDYMRVMGDRINSAKQDSAESLKKLIAEPADVSSYRRFVIYMIAPAGSIEVFAQAVAITDFAT